MGRETQSAPVSVYLGPDTGECTYRAVLRVEVIVADNVDVQVTLQRMPQSGRHAQSCLESQVDEFVAPALTGRKCTERQAPQHDMRGKIRFHLARRQHRWARAFVSTYSVLVCVTVTGLSLSRDARTAYVHTAWRNWGLRTVML